MKRRTVPRFWLQATASFPEGAPQREDYVDDRSFDKACCSYADEWRKTYVCEGCTDIECPQCGPQGSHEEGQ